MKKVFEGIFDNGVDTVSLHTEHGREPANCFLTEKLLQGKRVRITVEELPESKPEKNCGNCGRYYTGKCHLPGAVIQIQEIVKDCGDWQPKPAEPQSWEQRYRSLCEHIYLPPEWVEKAIVLIRAEIERVREEEKRAVIKYLEGDNPYSDLERGRVLHYKALDIKENKHRKTP